MPVGLLLKSAIVAAFLVIVTSGAYCDESYYVDDSPLYLYKTINWWYDSLPEESSKLCGRPVKCISIGMGQVVYDEAGKMMELNIANGFAQLLQAFKICQGCYGPSSFQCTWFDQNYFKDAALKVVIDSSSTISGFLFSNINAAQAQKIQGMAHELEFSLEGFIGGLANGRIALHGVGNLIKSCEKNDGGPSENHPIILKIGKTGSRAPLAIFEMQWER